MRKTTIKTNIAASIAAAASLTITDCFSKFTKHCIAKNLSFATMEFYNNNFNILTSIVGSNTEMESITIEQIEDSILYLKDKGQRTTSINSFLRAVRTFFYFCMERGYMPRFKIQLLKAEDTLKEPYTDLELKKLLKRPKSTNWTEWRNWSISNYFLGTGNRINTVINLKIEDIDFINDTIKLTTTKNKKAQIIPLSASLKAVLTEYLSLWQYETTDYLFPSCEGTQLTADGLKNIISNYNKSRGVTKTSCHLYRHTFAKMYIMNGGGMVQLQKLLGHSTLDMTRKYINLYGTDLQVNYEQFNPLNSFLK